MRQHNMLLGQATLPKKQVTRPKQVLTGGVLGNTGRGLSYQQYQGLVKGIDNLKETTTVQRKEYDEYVDYNEKATVRSDYNIADMTKLAKSLEHIIDDLRKKWAVQEKWNAYFKQMIENANNGVVSESTLESRLDALQSQIQQLQNKDNSNTLVTLSQGIQQQLDEKTKQITNLVRILQQLPGFVTSIDEICNKLDGGFDIKYKTVSFDDIDLDAELPVEPDSEDDNILNQPSENPDAGDTEEELPQPENPNPDEPDPEPVLDPISSAQTEVTLTSPADMKFSKLYADSTKLTDINTSLNGTKTAIEQIKNAIVSLQSSTPTITIVYVATINVYESGPVVINSRGSSSDMKFSCSRDRCRLTLNVTSTSTQFRIDSAVCNLRFAENHADFGGGEHSGRGSGAMSVLACRAYSSSNTNWSVDVYQFAQGNSNNNSWFSPEWNGKQGVFTIDVIAFGTIGTTSSSSSPTVNITPPTVPTTTDFTQSCGTSTSKEIPPEPKPEPEEGQ